MIVDLVISNQESVVVIDSNHRYLVDLGVLQLFDDQNQHPMTFQQALSLLDCVEFPFERYFVYSYLKKLGYIVRRPPELCTLPSNPPLCSRPLSHSKWTIHFNVFKPNSGFRKTDSHLEPDFCLCVCRFVISSFVAVLHLKIPICFFFLIVDRQILSQL
jgi:hypothetical protein